MKEPQDSFAGAVDPDVAAREYIVGRVTAGAKTEAIVQEMVQRGYDTHMARDLVRSVAQQHSGSARKSAVAYIAGGIAIAIGACILTYASDNSASQGGTYYICTGLILLGIYMAIRGTMQLIRGRETK